MSIAAQQHDCPFCRCTDALPDSVPDRDAVSVPREPTEAMLIAGNTSALSMDVLMDDTRFACERATYKAMLDAAIAAAQQEGKHG